MAGVPPNNQQLADQVPHLGNMTTAQQQEIDKLKASHKKEDNWCGLMDRKSMIPDRFEKREQWKEWAESYTEYVEEIHPLVASSLDRAKVHTEIIDPVYPTPEDKKLAKAVYLTMERFVKEPDGKQLVRSFPVSHNAESQPRS